MKEKILNNYLKNSDLFFDALFKRPESMAAYLPYEEYLPEHNVFVNKDGSLGAVFKFKLIEHEPLTKEQIIELTKSLNTLFKVPGNCTLQFLYEQSKIAHNDETITHIKNSYQDSHPVSNKIFSERISILEKTCLNRRLIVSIRYFREEDKILSIKRVLTKDDYFLYLQTKNFVNDLQNFKTILSNLTGNRDFVLEPMDGTDLLEFLRRYFNPKTSQKRSFLSYNDLNSMSEQVIYSNPTLSFDGIEREGVKTKTIYLKTNPRGAYPGGMAYFTTLNFPFLLSINFSFLSKVKAKRHFSIKEFFLQNTPSAKARIQRQEVLDVLERIERGETCMQMTFCVAVEGESEDELNYKTNEVIQIFQNKLECDVNVEEDIGLGLTLNSLPLFYNPIADYSSQRYITVLREDVVRLLPIFDSFKGMDRNLQLFKSRENNVVGFSLFNNQTSNHTVLVGDTGSGKSAFIINCIQGIKRINPEPLIFIVDRNSSYKMLSKYYEGDLTLFDLNKEMPFSPFRGVYDDQKFTFLTNLLITGIALTSSNFQIESEHTVAIHRALKKSYQKKLDQRGLIYKKGELQIEENNEEVMVNMSDFISELASLPSEAGFKKFSKQIDELLKKLRPFYSDGEFARYFQDHSNTKGTTSKFFIYDLGGLDSKPTLQTLMTMAVFEEIRQIKKLPENKPRETIIVFEELGTLGRNNPIAGKYVMDLAETTRKEGIWLIGVAPRPSNYFDNDVGRALWDAADNFIFLQMSPDNVEFLSQKSELLNEADKQIIKSLRTIKDQYVDIYYMNKTKSVQGAFRYEQTKLEKWLAPTNHVDMKTVEDAFEKFKDPWKALDHLMTL